MKRPSGWTGVAVGCVVAALLFAPRAHAANAPSAPALKSETEIVRVTFLQGDVRVNRGNQHGAPDLGKSWTPASAGEMIELGYVVGTGANGRAEIQSQGGSRIYLGENSLLLLNAATANGSGLRTTVQLISGAIVFAGNIGADESFQLVTATQILDESNGATQRIRVDAYLDGQIVTPRGKTHPFLWNFDGAWKPVPAGSAVVSTADGAAVVGAAPPDSFDRWVTSRVLARQARKRPAQATPLATALVPAYAAPEPSVTHPQLVARLLTHSMIGGSGAIGDEGESVAAMRNATTAVYYDYRHRAFIQHEQNVDDKFYAITPNLTLGFIGSGEKNRFTSKLISTDQASGCLAGGNDGCDGDE
jgi:FecR protein